MYMINVVSSSYIHIFCYILNKPVITYHIVRNKMYNNPHIKSTISLQFCFLIDSQELVASSPSERNWRGILIALLVIMAVLGLILFAIFLLSPGSMQFNTPTLIYNLNNLNVRGLAH